MTTNAQQLAAHEGIGLHLEDGFTVVHSYAHQVSQAYREGVLLVADGEDHAYDIYKRIADYLLAQEDVAVERVA